MGRPRKAYQLEELARIAKAREAAMVARRTATPAPYKERPPTIKVYAQSFIDNDLYIECNVTEETIVALCGSTSATDLAKFNLLTAVPSGKSSAPKKGNANKVLMGHLIHGASTPTPVVTPWGSRWIKMYDKRGKMSHRSFPFGATDIKAGITKFDTLFNRLTGTMKAELNENGDATLKIGQEAIFSV